MMKYSPAGQIVSVMASLVLGFVGETALPLEQEFHITFVQVVSLNKLFSMYNGNICYFLHIHIQACRKS